MPRFYFHVFNDEVAIDEEGQDFPDPEAARLSAIRDARSLICESIREGRVNLGHRIEIEDEAGGRVSLTFGEAFTIEG